MAAHLGRLPSKTSGDNPILGRLDSKSSTKEVAELLALTQRFDTGIIFKLSLASRSLTSVPGSITGCINLCQLDLSCNHLTRIEGLQELVQLTHLSLHHNRISQLENLSDLSKLEQLRLHDNQLSSLASLQLNEHLAKLPALRVLYLQDLFSGQPPGNKCCTDASYKKAVLAALPLLTNLDGERMPASSSYTNVVLDAKALVDRPPPNPEAVLPPVCSWLEPQLLQAALEDSNTEQDSTLEAPQKRLVRELDRAHMLHEVLTSETQAAQLMLQKKANAV